MVPTTTEVLSDDEILRYKWLMRMAFIASTRARCPRAHVGAVITMNKSIVAVSYNAAPSGSSHCEDTGCSFDAGHCIIATHAEINAIAGCARNGIKTDGGEIIITHSPCHACAKAILRAGIIRVVYETLYDDIGTNILLNAGAEVIQI